MVLGSKGSYIMNALTRPLFFSWGRMAHGIGEVSLHSHDSKKLLSDLQEIEKTKDSHWC